MLRVVANAWRDGVGGRMMWASEGNRLLWGYGPWPAGSLPSSRHSPHTYTNPQTASHGSTTALVVTPKGKRAKSRCFVAPHFVEIRRQEGLGPQCPAGGGVQPASGRAIWLCRVLQLEHGSRSVAVFVTPRPAGACPASAPTHRSNKPSSRTTGDLRHPRRPGAGR